MKYTQQHDIPQDYLRQKVKSFLAEDAPRGDYTTDAIFDDTQTVQAYIQAQEDLIFAGEQVIANYFDDSCVVRTLVKDGQWVAKDAKIAEIQGNVSKILLLERSLLNLLQRLCGIATETRKYVEVARPYNVRILDTRKTTPGLRLFEKYAVVAAGGYNHRFDLSSGILIKDNHISAAGGIKEAVSKVKEQRYGLPIEVEVETVYQIEEALACQVEGLLLDNMSPKEIAAAVELIKSHPRGAHVFIEASGGIRLNGLEAYVKTGVDAVSVGSLTHNIKSSDIHMEF